MIPVIGRGHGLSNEVRLTERRRGVPDGVPLRRARVLVLAGDGIPGLAEAQLDVLVPDALVDLGGLPAGGGAHEHGQAVLGRDEEADVWGVPVAGGAHHEAAGGVLVATGGELLEVEVGDDVAGGYLVEEAKAVGHSLCVTFQK